jgi:hypothetical protein
LDYRVGFAALEKISGFLCALIRVLQKLCGKSLAQTVGAGFSIFDEDRKMRVVSQICGAAA